MLFTDPLFLFYFLPVALIVHAGVARSSAEKSYSPVAAWFLFLLTLLFYGCKEPIWLLPFLFCLGFDYLWATLIARTQTRWIRRLFCFCSVSQNVLLLLFFKYNPMVENISAIPSISRDREPLLPPPGLSFYTFESLSFVLDVYRRQATLPRSIVHYLSFVGMFPRLIAGPIVRYRQWEAQVRDYRGPRFESGLFLLCLGLFYKLVFADQFHLWGPLAFTGEPSTVEAWVGTVAFTFELYFDFYGYSLMAIGIGQCLGFDFPENFRTPFFSRSVREFWKRWHITLGEWIQNYVFYPMALSPSRFPRLRFYVAITTTVILFGVWHGYGFQFVLLGVWFGSVLCVEHVARLPDRLPAVLHRPWVFLCVLIGWVFLRASSAPQAFGVLRALFGGGRVGPGLRLENLAVSHAPSVVLCALGAAYVLFLEERWDLRAVNPLPLRAVCGVLFLFLALIVGYSARSIPFLYFQF